MTTNPADIARALSEAQRRFLLQKGAGPKAGHNLHRKGLLEPCCEGVWRLTPLGLAVRDYLLHRPTASDASTDRNQATVVRCGKEIE